MATDDPYFAGLIATRDNIVAQLAAITNDKPEYIVDGQSVKSLRTQLLQQLKEINELIDDEKSEDSFVITSVADTS